MHAYMHGCFACFSNGNISKSHLARRVCRLNGGVRLHAGLLEAGSGNGAMGREKAQQVTLVQRTESSRGLTRMLVLLRALRW